MNMKPYRRHPDAVWREEDKPKEQAEHGLDKGEDVADIATSILLLRGEMLSLNLLGTDIWQRCEGKTLDELVASLAEDYEVEHDVLREDVSEFMFQLVTHGFVHEA